MRIIAVFILLTVCNYAFCQKQNNNWYFGQNTAITFNSGVPMALNSPMLQAEGCASISDANGNLLFFTDGVYVWNRNLQKMPNGFGLLGNGSATQSALIIPRPGDCHIYYIFTVPAQSNTVPLCYNIVDMSLDGGLGDVSNKNVRLHKPVTERLTGTLQRNGVDYWVIAQDYGSNAFYAYSITSAGVNTTPVISHSGPQLTFQNGGLNGIGYMKFSSDASKLAYANTIGSTNSQLFDFDNLSGIVSNNISLKDSSGYGVEFSSDNSKLYIANGGPPYIVTQYDLSQGSPIEIQNSATEIVHKYYEDSPFIAYGEALQLGPDGKIYADRLLYRFLSVINQPNLKGSLCDFQDTGVMLTNRCQDGLPNNIKQFGSSCTLPIVLLNFIYTLIDNSVKLQWQTAQEINSSYFSVEKSADGINFSPIGKVSAAGTSNGLRSYAYTDINPQAVNHYRLKEVDKDGKFTYSNILSVKLPSSQSFTIIQNPVQNILQLQSSQSGYYYIYDFSGRRIKTGTAQTGSQAINVSSLASGVYILQMISANGCVSSKVFEKR